MKRESSSAVLDQVLRDGLPANLDAERSVLGAILLDNAAYNSAAEVLESDHFSDGRNRRMFALMLTLAESGNPIDALTLTNEAIQQGGLPALEAIGGASYIASLTEGLPRSVNVAHYARIVKDKAILRQTVHLANSAMKQALDGSDDPAHLLARVVESFQALEEASEVSGPVQVGEFFSRQYKSLDHFVNSGRRKLGLDTGFRGLDELTLGLQPGDLILLAGRPSMGKTAFALDVAAHVACHAGKPVLIFSLEMTKDALLRRLACAQVRINSLKLQSGALTKDEARRLSAALAVLTRAPLYIDDKPALRIHELHARARRWHREKRFGLVVLDYIQLMTPPKSENRTQEVDVLSRGLKTLAKELNIPVLALSQLSRAPDQRAGDNNRPRLSDLRDSGALEQNADVVALLYREEYYVRQAGREPSADLKDRAELIIAKQRNGPTGDVPLVFTSKFASFANFAG